MDNRNKRIAKNTILLYVRMFFFTCHRIIFDTLGIACFRCGRLWCVQYRWWHCYHVTDKIVQVVYWGDKPGYGELKPINFLAYELIQFYGKLGMKYLDIGPSTENSIPNFGLCDFKESIGCERSLKFTFKKELL